MATITRGELIQLAQSRNPADRQKALEIYQAWIKAAPELAPSDRLSGSVRVILNDLLREKKPNGGLR